MSVISYLTSKRIPVLRMPVCPLGVDESGIKWEGAVLEGKLSVEEALRRDGAGHRGK